MKEYGEKICISYMHVFSEKDTSYILNMSSPQNRIGAAWWSLSLFPLYKRFEIFFFNVGVQLTTLQQEIALIQRQRFGRMTMGCQVLFSKYETNLLRYKIHSTDLYVIFA